MNDFRKIMVDLAQAGYSVFPYLKRFQVGDNGKGVPINANGTNDEKTDKWSASNDMSKVLDWINEDDIIGYGVTNKEVFMIDIDCGQGKAKSEEALESWQRMKEHLKLPKPSITIQSPSGGYHLYYKKPDFETMAVTKSKEFVGIDFPWHCSGPMLIDDTGKKGTYTLIRGKISNVLAPLSNTFLTWLKEAHGRIDYKDATAGLIMPDEIDTFDGSIPDIIPSGDRHYTILRLIGSWVRQGVTRKNAIILIQAALDKCEGSPPKSLDEYIGELDNTLSKSSFNRVMPEPLKFFLENMVYVKSEDGVYELNSRRFYNKGLRNVYAQHRWYKDPKEENPNSKAAIKEIFAYEQWLKDKDRITVEGIAYKPVKTKVFKNEQNDGIEYANLYHPPIIGKPSDNEEIWDLFVDLAKVVGQDKWLILLEWAACQVQIPEKKLQIAVALISELRGIGKNLFLYIIRECIGRQNFEEVSSVEELFETHVEFPIKNHLVVINEAESQLTDRYGHKHVERYLNMTKDIISKRQVSVNIKYLRTSTVEFYTNFAFTSNNLHAIPMEENDRRFEVFIGKSEKLSEEIYSKLWNFNKGDISLIRKKLKEMDLVTINEKYSATEVDENKQVVIDASRPFVESDIVDAIKNHKSVFRQDIVTFELFAWFILNNSSKVSQGYCRDLFKKYCKPVYRKNSNRPRDPKVKVPSLEFKFDDTLIACEKQRALYCIRNSASINSKTGRNEQVSLYKRLYDDNFTATDFNYIEPDVFYADEEVQKLIESV